MKIVKLSESFYKKYSGCHEIMKKEDRPYYCLQVRIRETTFAIPFRHHIKHQHAFITIAEAGLDYTKAVVIADESMISPDPVRIETAEWNFLKGHEDHVYAGFLKYLRLYQKALRNQGVPKYQKIIQYSALQYFDL